MALHWQILYLIVLILSTAISISLSVYAWQQRNQPGVFYFSGMMLAVTWYVISSGLMSVSRTPEQANFWVNPHFLGLTSMLAFFITFVIRFTGHEKWLTRTALTIFFSIPVITQIVIETNPLHHWFIKHINFVQIGFLMGLDNIQYGTFFWFHSVYSYALVLVGMGLIIHLAIRTFKIYRTQSFTLLLGVLPPLLGSINDSRLFFPGFEFPLVPIGFALMGMIFAWNMFRYRLLNVIPVARDMLVDSMSDAVLVLDNTSVIVDANQSALNLLQRDASAVIGEQVAQVLNPWVDLLERYKNVPKVQTEIRLLHEKEERYFDLGITPLLNRYARPIGKVITLHDNTARKKVELQLQEMLAENKALQEQLRDQAIHDPLTGLYNRRHLNDILPHELARAQRNDYPVSLILMDIDFFKAVNDQYGHLAGDQMLQQIAAWMQEHTRSSDYVYRYGGEEFLVILVNTSLKAARYYAERWRSFLQSAQISIEQGMVTVTMSMGIAVYPIDGSTPDALLSAADEALYSAKNRGRNQIALSSKPQ